MATLLSNSTQKALTTLARAKSFLEITGDSKDTLLTILINQATGFIENYCKRRFLSQTYTNEVYDGTGGNTLVLKNFPVTAFTSLQVNAGTIGSPSWQTVDSNLYGWYEDGRITLGNPKDSFLGAQGGQFLNDPQKYRATYVAGYLISFDNENDPAQHTLPQEVEMACLMLLSAAVNARKGAGLQSARVGDISMTYRAAVINDGDLKAMLDKYVAASI